MYRNYFSTKLSRVALGFIVGLKEFLHVDFDSPLVTSALQGSIHSELVSFQFKPGKLKISPDHIPNFSKEEHGPILSSKTLEDYIAGIIKDKPVNIDKFFDYVVKEVLKRNESIIHRLEKCLEVATNCQNENVQEMIKQALENYQPHFSKDFLEYTKWQESQKKNKVDKPTEEMDESVQEKEISLHASKPL